jgi:hypothetical protein
MSTQKHSQQIVRELAETLEQSKAINRLLKDIEDLRSEVWVLRTTLFISVIGLVMMTITRAFGG